ncbi:MAG: tetratricopeptide repeat protein, partial [Candidatus Eisenbacteria sp.]|nr:tetratricopeptide repeat protein [Candidatus Eisenbacteria bacterium]
SRTVAGVGVVLAGLLPGAILRQPGLFGLGAAVGLAGAIVVLTQRERKIPAALTALAALALIAGFTMGGAEAPVLAAGLADTGFSRAVRRSGEFEMFDRGGAAKEHQLLADGIERFRRGDFEGAVAAFKQVSELDPENVQAYVSIGSAYMRMDRLTEAANAFRRALVLDPDDAMARVGMAQVHKLWGQPDQALEELEGALEHDPENADAHYTKAIIYQELDELELELEALVATAAVDPRNSMAMSRLADIYLASEMHAEAVSALKAALTGRTPVEHAHTRLAEAYYAMGNVDAAENELRKEIVLRPKLASPHANLAHLLAEQGRSAEAVHEYEAARSLTNDERMIEFLERELGGLRQ